MTKLFFIAIIIFIVCFILFFLSRKTLPLKKISRMALLMTLGIVIVLMSSFADGEWVWPDFNKSGIISCPYCCQSIEKRVDNKIYNDGRDRYNRKTNYSEYVQECPECRQIIRFLFNNYAVTESYLGYFDIARIISFIIGLCLVAIACTDERNDKRQKTGGRWLP